jgi:hypothetical protein
MGSYLVRLSLGVRCKVSRSSTCCFTEGVKNVAPHHNIDILSIFIVYSNMMDLYRLICGSHWTNYDVFGVEIESNRAPLFIGPCKCRNLFDVLWTWIELNFET